MAPTWFLRLGGNPSFHSYFLSSVTQQSGTGTFSRQGLGSSEPLSNGGALFTHKTLNIFGFGICEDRRKEPSFLSVGFTPGVP